MVSDELLSKYIALNNVTPYLLFESFNFNKSIFVLVSYNGAEQLVSNKEHIINIFLNIIMH